MNEHIERELSIEASAEDVWAVITSPGWLADEVELELRPGGEARFRTASFLKEGWVEEALAPYRLAFWWAPAGEPASRVQLTLEGTDEGTTRVHVVESRPLDALDLVGVPLSRLGGVSYGPALVAA